MSLCQKVLGEYHPFFGRKYFFRLKFFLNKPNFIRKSTHQRDKKDKLDSQSQFWLVKYDNLHQFRFSAENRQRKGGHFGCTGLVVVMLASFFFRQFSLSCLTGHSQSFLILEKTACKIWIIERNIFQSKHIGSSSDADWNVRLLLFTADLRVVKQRKLLLKSVFSRKQW